MLDHPCTLTFTHPFSHPHTPFIPTLSQSYSLISTLAQLSMPTLTLTCTQTHTLSHACTTIPTLSHPYQLIPTLFHPCLHHIYYSHPHTPYPPETIQADPYPFTLIYTHNHSLIYSHPCYHSYSYAFQSPIPSLMPPCPPTPTHTDPYSHSFLHNLLWAFQYVITYKCYKIRNIYIFFQMCFLSLCFNPTSVSFV